MFKTTPYDKYSLRYTLKKYKVLYIMNRVTKEEAITGAFYGAIVGDALCLGSHYEYDAQKIYEAYGKKPIEKYMSPGEMMGGVTHGIGWGERNYHPGKRAGDRLLCSPGRSPG